MKSLSMLKRNTRNFFSLLHHIYLSDPTNSSLALSMSIQHYNVNLHQDALSKIEINISWQRNRDLSPHSHSAGSTALFNISISIQIQQPTTFMLVLFFLLRCVVSISRKTSARNQWRENRNIFDTNKNSIHNFCYTYML